MASFPRIKRRISSGRSLLLLATPSQFWMLCLTTTLIIQGVSALLNTPTDQSKFSLRSRWSILATSLQHNNVSFRNWGLLMGSTNNEQDEAFNMEELASRVDRMRQQEEAGSLFSLATPRYRQLVTIAFDSLLPGQQLQGRTTDPNFMRLLRDDVGLGGSFFMISVNPFKRMLRRNGVLCRIDFMDAKLSTENKHVLPSAIDFVISTISPNQSAACRLVGPSETFRTRVGRWRRCYDPDGEEVLLGWGEERFLDAVPKATSLTDDLPSSADLDCKEAGLAPKENMCDQNQPSLCWVDCQVDREDEATEITDEVRDLAEELIPLLEKWEHLASDPKTYENVNVVATSGLSKGTLSRIDPAAVFRQVKTNLGGCGMPPADDPHALAYWAAALLNPLPALGISPEIRGRVLEAATTKERMQIVKWGTERSIRNLQGTDPL